MSDMVDFTIEVEAIATIREAWRVTAPEGSTPDDLMDVLFTGDFENSECLGDRVVGGEHDREFVQILSPTV